MPKSDANPERPISQRFDVEAHHHVDQAGNLWSLGLVLSIRDGVLCLKELAIRPVGHNEQLTSAVLRGINVRDLVSHERRHLIEEGIGFRDAIVQGSMERLSPILMTALVTGVTAALKDITDLM